MEPLEPIYSNIRKNAQLTGGHVFQPSGTIFKLVQEIMGTNLLTKFHDERTINVLLKPCKEKCTAPGGHVFQPTIFELAQGFITTNLLTNFYEDRTINVASSVLTRQMLTPYNEQKAITKAHHEHIVLR
ncbi:hypothetical protein DPMN_114416 [Dreissena polymorpha]|uniref:Uncharacterized protein n=1 Tax=Dreissena polymorpha TaxID=45954 RepID=A0A9D4QRZ7_DREPO|nr:hypothetical protein DPMN_114416 [Dreissena polymorpha]